MDTFTSNLKKMYKNKGNTTIIASNLYLSVFILIHHAVYYAYSREEYPVLLWCPKIIQLRNKIYFLHIYMCVYLDI